MPPFCHTLRLYLDRPFEEFHDNPSTVSQPDRSDFIPNFTKTAENDALEIGWAEGVLSDGRPYRYECWCQDQMTLVTIFIARPALGDLDRKGLEAFLKREKLVRFASARRFVDAMHFIDPSGHEMLSVNVVVGDEEEVYVTGGPALRRYQR